MMITLRTQRVNYLVSIAIIVVIIFSSKITSQVHKYMFCKKKSSSSSKEYVTGQN